MLNSTFVNWKEYNTVKTHSSHLTTIHSTTIKNYNSSEQRNLLTSAQSYSCCSTSHSCDCDLGSLQSIHTYNLYSGFNCSPKSRSTCISHGFSTALINLGYFLAPGNFHREENRWAFLISKTKALSLYKAAKKQLLEIALQNNSTVFAC